MSSSPKKKSEGRSKPDRPPAKPPGERPAPARAEFSGKSGAVPSHPVAASQQAMNEKSRRPEESSDTADAGDHPNVLKVWLRQSPSWLTSMVVHMVLLLVLGLWAMPQEVKDNFKEIVLGTPDIQEEDDLEEEDTNESLNEELDSVESNAQEDVEDIVSPVDFQVDSPDVVIPNNADDIELAAAKIDFSDMAIDSAVSGDVLGAVGGISNSGLGGRSAQGRAAAVRQGGGDPGTEAAVEAALKWLAYHQNSNGSWSWGHTPGGRCSGYANPGAKKSMMGATGLALLPFLGAGYTHTEGKYQDTVQRGLRYLVGNMKVENNAGRLFEDDGSSSEHMYCHGIATCALAEAYGMTQDSELMAPAQLALNYIVQAQHPENGGWNYTPRSGGDTSVVGWQIMALKSGILSYLQVPGNVKTLANKWLDFVQVDVPPDGYGIGSRYSYRGPRSHSSHALTAIGLLCRNYLGTPKDDPGLRMGVRWVAEKGPQVPRCNMYYNYYGSQLMYQNDGPDGAMWKAWNAKMKGYLVESQVKQGSDRGSWYFNGGHGPRSGGRVYCTAMAAMTLEVYYRYMPIYQKKNVENDDFPLE